MATKRIAKNRVKRMGRNGQILNQFFRTLVKNQQPAKPEVDHADQVQTQP
jgi:hypothetical protein